MSAAPVVLGGGTRAGARAASRWRAARWPLAVVGVLVLGAALAAVLQPQVSSDPLAPDNPGPGGAQAAASVLADQGVRVTVVRSTDDALATAREGTTLMVVGSFLLDDAAVARIAEVPADLVLVGVEAYHLDALTDGAVQGGFSLTGPAQARCEDPDAVAAGQVTGGSFGLTTADPRVELCFTDAGGGGSYASLELSGRRVAVLADATAMSNARLADAGHAALVLRSLGHHEELIWYLPSLGDVAAGPGLLDLLPGWAGAVAAILALTAAALALWRGRRLGPVVTEPLPVIVSSAETTLGRGRLYRRARSRGHAAAALRAGTARRVAARLGLPRSAGAEPLVDALVRATGRPSEQVAGLLYGPPPTDDAGLIALARLLDDLESEVHRT